ncbi:hypothetical protein Cgig2_016947 [Carnegiea gigantea]|uniref:Remorin C-terminal domain-containing protein n=1 Tax=Carnegiea gigantea TaxID=171969 RepID=A0A9Q1JQC2_9CARY|nr:hypothetical protein Cgig2_016947 [Carnegiea gigantea]
MEYERIERPQRGGGLSPAKLRSMLMGVEKKRRDLEDVDSSCSLRSQLSGIDDPGCDFSESCKDVDVVREHVECSTSTTADSEGTVSCRFTEPLASSGTRSNDRFEVEYENGHDNVSMTAATFEFQKTERGSHRVPAARFAKPAPSKWDDAQKWIASPNSNRLKTAQLQSVQGGARKVNNLSHGVRKPATKIVAEVPDGKLIPFEEPETKMIDSSIAKKANAGQQLMKWESDPCPLAILHGKAAQLIEKSVGEPLARSISMKDMGTEMTPITSQEPSRSGTPVKMKSPMVSPTSSRTSTPTRAHPPGVHAEIQNFSVDVRRKELSEKELHLKTRKEIMELGMQLGKMNITSWASKEDEDTAAASSLKTMAVEQAPRSVVETRAEAWEEAEKAKYMARTCGMLVEVERMKAKAQDKLMNKLAAVRHKAEEKRAAAEAKMHEQAAKSEQQAEYIRKTGRIPSKFSCWSCCS